MPAYEPFVPGQIYGTGEEQNWFDGQPQQSSFQGMSPWWCVPTSWYIRTVDSQIFASPTWNFSAWVFAVKIDQDGAMKFQMPYGIRQNGLQRQLPAFEVTFPPSEIFAQAIFFTDLFPSVLPANKDLPALAYGENTFLFGWNNSLYFWFPIIGLNNDHQIPSLMAALDAGSDQIMMFSDQVLTPNDQTLPALMYNATASLYGWHTKYNYWIPIISPDGLILNAVSSPANPEGQIVFGQSDTPTTPVDQTEPQLFYNANSKLYGWNNSSLSQIAIIS